MRVAVVGAGWAGMAAAVAAVERGHNVTVFEAARTVGGRARTVLAAQADGTALALDNGQHILIGAYSECLRLMRLAGVDPDTALHREPLNLCFPDGTGLTLPDNAPPWDALVGILRARGWRWGERLALLNRALRWCMGGFSCAPAASVAGLCAGMPPRLMQEFIAPLCVSALNTPPELASGQVFLTVLRDSLFAGRGGSHLLLPRVPMGELLPVPAIRHLQQHGHAVRMGTRVQTLQHDGATWWLDGESFDAVLLACSSSEAARLAAQATATPAMRTTLQTWADTAQALEFGAIATVYAEHPHASGPVLAHAMLALRPTPDQPAQFVFDRGRLDGPPGLLAFVVSAFTGEREVLQQQVRKQAAQALGLPRLNILQTVIEKRATFACTPALRRPVMQLAPGLLACGDYIEGPYPATLEGAVRCGIQAAGAIEPGQAPGTS